MELTYAQRIKLWRVNWNAWINGHGRTPGQQDSGDLLADLKSARDANAALVAENEILKEQLSYYDYQAAVQMGASPS